MIKIKHIQGLLRTVGKLSAHQCQEVRKVLDKREVQVESDLLLAELTDAVDSCPRCSCKAISRVGSKGGRKRFKCKKCLKTFNALTGTAMARLRKAPKYVEYAAWMVVVAPLRWAAEELEVDVHTVFRWRHRFLDSIRRIQPEKLTGLVEADETFFLLSYKGSRHLPPGRIAKKKGTPARKRGLSNEQIPVLVARDRSTGNTLTSRIPSRRAMDIAPLLLPRLGKDAVLCSDGASAYRIIAKRAEIEVKSTPAKQSAGVYHIQNVNSYDSRLKTWMKRFKGVATKYLDNYLSWHRLLDRKGAHMSSGDFLLAVLNRS